MEKRREEKKPKGTEEKISDEVRWRKKKGWTFLWGKWGMRDVDIRM